MEKYMKLEDRFMLMMCDFIIDFYDDKTGECVQTAEAYDIMDGIIARKVERDEVRLRLKEKEKARMYRKNGGDLIDKLNYLSEIGYGEF